MLLKDFKPCWPLLEWIKCYRIVHFNFDASSKPPPKPYTPRPEQCLAFYPLDTEMVSYADSKTTLRGVRVALVGQHSKVSFREVGSSFLVVQVIFQPGALYRLCGVPTFEFYNQYIDATLVFDNQLHLVNEQLYHATEYITMINVLDHFFTQKIAKIKRQGSRVDYTIKLLNHTPNQSLEYLSKLSCYSYKQFERQFYTRTGVSPRFYKRLVRFDNAFRMKNLPNPKSWREIAWDSNYTDYQHLMKDYKEFTGYTPYEFHHLGSPEEILGMAESFYEMEER